MTALDWEAFQRKFSDIAVSTPAAKSAGAKKESVCGSNGVKFGNGWPGIRDCRDVAKNEIFEMDDNNTMTGFYFAVKFDMGIHENARFETCIFVGVTFFNCNFTNTIWANVYLQDVTFENCEFTDEIWYSDRLVGKSIKGEDFVKHTQLGKHIPTEISDGQWLLDQQHALDGTARLTLQEENDYLLASRLQAGEDESAAGEREKAKGLPKIPVTLEPAAEIDRQTASKSHKEKKHPYFDGFYDDIEEPMKADPKVRTFPVVAGPAEGGLIDLGE